ncbi:MAG: hypothetical protein FWC73_13515, partial [Defluviitaleaceae bacterium]|nr:hypothetical protein [Defluviitaleaceae bacterium]
MVRMFRRLMLAAIILALGIVLLAGCGGNGNDNDVVDTGTTTNENGTDTVENNNNDDDDNDTVDASVERPHDFDDSVVGEITIMTWGGDGQVWMDAGRQNPDPEDINGNYTAMMLATARAF